MSTAPSRSRIVKCATTVERQYGGDVDGMQNIDAEQDGFSLFAKGDPVTQEVAMVDNAPLRGAFTRGLRTPGLRSYKWAGKVYANRLTTDINTPAASDPYDFDEYTTDLLLRGQDRPWGPLWLSCGLKPNYSVENKVTFAPASNSVDQRSCRIVTELDGTFFDIQGARGSFTINGTAGQPLEISFDMQGKPATFAGEILDPVHTAAELEDVSNWSTWAGGSTDNPLFQCANGQIVTATDTLSAGDFVLKSFAFNRGVTVEARTDANDCESVREYGISDAAPTLELVIECSQDVNNWIASGDLLNPWKDWRTAGTHAVSFSHGRTVSEFGGLGSSANAQWDFNFPQCQLTNVVTGEGDGGIRTLTLSYDVINTTTDDGEFSIVWWGDTAP